MFLPQDLFVGGQGLFLFHEVEAVEPREVCPLFLQDGKLPLQGVEPSIGNEGLADAVALHHLVKVELGLNARQDAVAGRMA